MWEEGTEDGEEIVRILVSEGVLEQAREVANKHAEDALNTVAAWKE